MLATMYWRALQIGQPRLLDEQQMRDVLERFARYQSGAGAPSTPSKSPE
jgi:hypothetical protein